MRPEAENCSVRNFPNREELLFLRQQNVKIDKQVHLDVEVCVPDRLRTTKALHYRVGLQNARVEV